MHHSGNPEIEQPTEAEIQAIIAEIELMVNRRAEIEALKAKLRRLIQGRRTNVPIIDAGARLFRGRVVDAKPTSAMQQSYAADVLLQLGSDHSAA